MKANHSFHAVVMTPLPIEQLRVHSPQRLIVSQKQNAAATRTDTKKHGCEKTKKPTSKNVSPAPNAYQRRLEKTSRPRRPLSAGPGSTRTARPARGRAASSPAAPAFPSPLPRPRRRLHRHRQTRGTAGSLGPTMLALPPSPPVLLVLRQRRRSLFLYLFLSGACHCPPRGCTAPSPLRPSSCPPRRGCSPFPRVSPPPAAAAVPPPLLPLSPLLAARSVPFWPTVSTPWPRRRSGWAEGRA